MTDEKPMAVLVFDVAKISAGKAVETGNGTTLDHPSDGILNPPSPIEEAKA